jgi:hypothetical protein
VWQKPERIEEANVYFPVRDVFKYFEKIMFLPHKLYLNLGGYQQHLAAVNIDLRITTMHLVVKLERE